MKKLETMEYISVLRELVKEGKEVNLTIAGNSMAPFLIHGRDTICFRKPLKDLKTGDMVFYQRNNGQFVMHRICKVDKRGYFIVGDAQVDVEGPVSAGQIFAVVTKVKRKGKWIGPGDFWWEFYEHIWIRLVPFRRGIIKIYGMMKGM